jgi:hypothetical protein
MIRNNSLKFHKILARYFSSQSLFFDGDLQKKPNIRKCMEQPWQQTNMKSWKDGVNNYHNFSHSLSSAEMTININEDE